VGFVAPASCRHGWPPGWRRYQDLLDPAAGQDGFVVVEDGGLAWGDCALGSFEGDAGAIVGESFDGGGGGVVLVADFCLAEDRHGWLRDGNPIYIFNFECARAQRFVFADDNAIVSRIYRNHIDGLAGCEAEAFALADSVIVYACVAADDRAIFGDDCRLPDCSQRFLRRGNRRG